MPIPDRQQTDIGHPRWSVLVTDDASRTLYDPHTTVGFHSGCGAVSETQWVYLRGGGVADRLSAGQPTSVLEIGVGLGLALLMTCDAALRGDASLRYVGLEPNRLPGSVLRHLRYGGHLFAPELFDRWIAGIDSPVDRGNDDDPAIRLDLAASLDVSVVTVGLIDWLGGRDFDPADKFDAIYFDPFDPAESPSLWTEEVFHGLTKCVRPGGRLVTYCVKRSVRDAMARAGWRVDRVPGPPGGKRQVAVATFPK